MEFFEFVGIAQTALYADVYNRFLWVYLLVGGVCYAVVYALEAAGLYTIAKREGFKNKWMAFIPFLNTYYIGVVAEKNKVYKVKAKYISLATAGVELVYVGLSVLYLVALSLIFNGGYAVAEYSTAQYGNMTLEIPNGYSAAANLPAELNWAWWVFSNLQTYVLYWVQLIYIVLNMFLMVSFFRTYSSRRYFLFSILCVLFPVKGIIIFAVRKNNGVNYLEYLREQQQRQYRMYQEYMRGGMNGQSGQSGANANGQNGGYYGGYQGNPYAGQHTETPPDDPFGGLGASNQEGRGGNSDGGNGGDPFDEFKN
ncbi:MAG: hypothetical protein K2K39_01190 [Clostridia bacterium]|nr:hypothetical protein [Clostridia bacterium]